MIHVFDAAAFWKILAIVIIVLLVFITVAFVIDTYVRFMYYQDDCKEKFKREILELVQNDENNC